MMTHSDVTDSLGALRDHPVAIDQQRIDRIERRVFDALTADDMANPVEATVTRARARGGRRTVMLGAVAACVLAVVLLVVNPVATDHDSLVLAAADGVDVVLPDGTGVVGAAGVELPNGSMIVVTGSMSIDDVDYGPGRYTVTDDGILEALRTAPRNAPPPPPTAPTRAPVPTTQPPPTPTTTLVERPVSTTTLDDPETTRPPTTIVERPTTTAVRSPAPPTTAVRGPAPPPTRSAPTTAPTNRTPATTSPPPPSLPRRGG